MKTIELKPFTAKAEDGEEAVIYYGEMVFDNLMLFLRRDEINSDVANHNLQGTKRNGHLKFKMYMLNASISGDDSEIDALHNSIFILPDEFSNAESCIVKCKKFLGKFGVESALANSKEILQNGYKFNFLTNLNETDEYITLHTGTTHREDVSLIGVDFQNRKIVNIENEPIVYREEDHDLPDGSFFNIVVTNSVDVLLIKPEIIYNKAL